MGNYFAADRGTARVTIRSIYIEARVAAVRLQFIWEDSSRHIWRRRSLKPVAGPFMMRQEDIELAEEMLGPEVTFGPVGREK